MPKPMRITKDILDQITAAFLQKLPTMQILDGRISYVQDFIFRKNDRAVVTFTREAYDKMMALVDHFDTEIGWHGLVSRTDRNHFVIDDILVYPQTVSHTDVNTDQEGYDQWIMTIEGDDFNRLKFHGHSHVDMGVTPSATDLQHQGGIVAQLGNDGFYIFLIINKRREYTVKVYDAESNTLYEKDSVDIIIPDSAKELDKFLTAAEKQVTRYVYNPNRPYAVTGKPGSSTTAKGNQKSTGKAGKNTPTYSGGTSSTRRSSSVGAPRSAAMDEDDELEAMLSGVTDFDAMIFGDDYPYNQ